MAKKAAGGCPCAAGMGGGAAPRVSRMARLERAGWVIAGILAVMLVVALVYIAMRGPKSGRMGSAPAPPPVTVQVISKSPDVGVSVGGAVKPDHMPQYERQTQEFQQTGILTSTKEGEKEPMILPLYGKRYDRQDRWLYYAASEKPFHLWRVPITVDKRTCEEQPGCRELQTGDDVVVPIYGDRTFKANMYKPEAPQYFADRV